MVEQQDIEKTLNFAEANVEDKKEIRFFRDYMGRRFMVGYCKRDKWAWIKKNKIYNIRPESAKRQGGVNESDPMSFAVDYIIIYKNRNRNQYHVFKVDHYEHLSLEQMHEKGYANPHSDYLCFFFNDEVKFEKIDLQCIIERENGEDPFAPIYLSGSTIYSCYRFLGQKKIGLVDADLLYGGTRHPNLALLKIAGYLLDNNVSFELIIDPHVDTTQYYRIYMSRVFTFTKEPEFYSNASDSEKKKFQCGGTGYYANVKTVKEFREKREADMNGLPNDPYLKTLTCKQSGQHGIDMARQMPFYDLYKEYIQKQLDAGQKREKYKDYLDFSIGFLTRKCYRHCPFCVNKLEDGVVPYSKLEWFYDKKRPHVYFWDDNFLAAKYEVWKPQLQYLIDHNISFQFRQGLDERQLAESPHGEEMARMLSQTKYVGDFIFAFDNWKDRDIIERALKIWKRNCPKKGTKFYLFCGFMLKPDTYDKFYKDIWELFQRIKILMQYGCVGYVMRHEDYHISPVPNLYVQLARWCNQQAFYKKMSFWEFCYRNQSYWEEQQKVHDANRPQLMSFEDFMRDVNAGVYGEGEGQIKMCLPLKTILNVLEMFPDHKQELIEMFNYKMENLINPQLWEIKE